MQYDVSLNAISRRYLRGKKDFSDTHIRLETVFYKKGKACQKRIIELCLKTNIESRSCGTGVNSL